MSIKVLDTREGYFVLFDNLFVFEIVVVCMVFKCTNCEVEVWSDECEMGYFGGSGVIVCPECSSSLNRVVGEVEKAIFKAIPSDGSISASELSGETGIEQETIKRSLSHLIDMGYFGTTAEWQYRLGTKGREKKKEIGK
jgi:DNA-directed RNA polymerase subunit RPC12/RpoP